MLTTYDLADGVATITMDDGKVNALSAAMLAELAGRFTQAATDEAIVILTGRATTFSAGFDLRCPPDEFVAMVADGARLAEQVLTHPRPVIAACNGNAVAMGAFLLLACDVRIGAPEGRIGANEVAIGLTIPYFATALMQYRLTPPYADRCGTTGVLLDAEEARTAGFLDALTDDPLAAAREQAAALAGVNPAAHLATKTKLRADVVAGVRDGIARFTDGREF